ncbi:hypothetical protein KPL70_012223 [Citrus sinensis]|nr:hypothetical protein KPL70_012223 [Citrus sinensis]
MNEKACGQIRSCLTRDVKVKDEECAVTLWRTLEEKYLVKSPENRLHAMSQVYGFRMKPGVSMHDHVSRFEKLLADLKNLDEDIKDEVKAMILLHSLPKEYSHFVTTLIYGKSVIVFKDVCTVLTSLEIRNNDKNSERASSEALGHWRKGCPKAQKRDGKKPAAANMARKDEGSDYSLSITPAAYVASSNKGYKVTIEDGIMKFTHGAMVILQGVRRHNLYYLKGGTTDEANVVEAHSDTTKLWHVRLGHVGEKCLQTLMRRVWVYTMRAKDEVLEIFVKWKKLVETQTGRKIKVLRSDNGGEYTSDPFLQVCQNEGIKRHFTVRHTPQQNGVAKRMNRTLLEKVRCLLSNAGLDKKFWAEAVSYTSHLANRLPSITIGGKTPIEMWSGKHAQDYDSFRIFGCPTYYHVKDGKLDPRARKTIFVGFKGGVKGFKLWDLEDKKWRTRPKRYCSGVEFDATPYVPVSSTSKKSSTMEVTPRVEEEVRLVAKGFAQKECIDYNEVFSPVVKHTSIRILFALVAEYELELAQLDVKTAFLHGDLEEEIYMIQLCGFRVAGKENHMCRLIKSLYGLKQSPRQWYKRFDQFIQGQKFTRSEHDHCVYFRRLPDGAFIYLLLYVDDMFIVSKNKDEIERLKKQLASEFEMKDLGAAQRILGMEIRRDKKNRSIWLTQKSYLKKVLERFGMDDKTKPICTPLALHFKLSSSSCPKSQEERDYMACVPYASVVGSLMYAMILRHLYGTVDVGLLFKKDCGQQCVGYCHSDFAGDLDKRRSTTGYVFTLGGGPVSWRSILQSTIALSTTEAEYMAATEAVKKAI